MPTLESPLSADAVREGALDAIWQSSLPTDHEIRRGRRRLHAKATVIAILLAVAYWTLVIADSALWLRLVAGVALVAGLLATATSIMHDGNHGSFSRFRWLNRLAGSTGDLLGASSWLWRFKHNHLHHGNTNVEGMDSDIEQQPFARLAPGQQWRPWHRWQRFYLWPLYGFFGMKNMFFGDVRNLRNRQIGPVTLPHEPGRAVSTRLLLGKAAHISWALAIPLLFNPWQHVLLFYFVSSWAVGFSLAVLFQLAHCVDLAGFTDAEAPRRGSHFTSHQLLTTVDISSPVPAFGHAFRWLAGGLDHQLEHHLAPRLPHTVYPAVARRFRARCAEAGFTAKVHTGLWAALRSHYRWISEMGRPPVRALVLDRRGLS